MTKAAAVEAPKAAVPAVPIDPNAPVPVTVQQSDDGLRLTLPFAAPTPAAVFRRVDMLWLVFDTKAKIDIAALAARPHGVRHASLTRGADGEAILRIRLDRPRLVSAVAEGATWTVTVADTMVRPPQPLTILRSLASRDRANIAIPFEQASAIHHLRDPEIGDRLTVVTAPAPSRGFLKDQHFVELRAAGVEPGRGRAADRRRPDGDAVGQQDRHLASARAVAVGDGARQAGLRSRPSRT